VLDANSAKSESSVTLIVSSKELMPALVTELIGLEPDQSWQCGDEEVLPNGRKHKFDQGCWKRFQPTAQNGLPLIRQIEFWLSTLSHKKLEFKKLEELGYSVEFNCFLTDNEEIFITLPPSLLLNLAELGITISFDILFDI